MAKDRTSGPTTPEPGITGEPAATQKHPPSDTENPTDVRERPLSSDGSPGDVPGSGSPSQVAVEDQAGPPRRGSRRSAYAERDLTSGSVRRNLWFLAWPQVADSGLNVGDQLIDLVWAGMSVGARGIAGIGAAQTYIFLIRLGRQGIDMAMRAMIARAVGAGDLRLANHVAVQAFMLNLALAFITIIPGILLTEHLLRFLGVSQAVVDAGAGYMKVQFVASFAQGFRMMAGAALQASGDTYTPMRASLVARVVDWVLTPFIVFGWWGLPEMGLVGIAWVNTLSGAIGLAINAWGLFTGTSKLRLTFRGFYLDPRLIGRIFWIGLPATVTSMDRSLSQLILLGVVARFGDFALAAFYLARRLETVAMMAGMGMGQATGVIASQNLGAGKPQRAKETVYWALGIVILFQVVLGILFFAFPLFFLSIFSREPELLEIGDTWLRILVLGFCLMAVMQVYQLTYQIAGDTLVAMITTICTVWAVELPLAILLSGGGILGWTLPSYMNLGQFGVAWAVVIGVGCRLLVYVPYFYWGPWTRKRVIEGLTVRPGRAWGGSE